MKTLRLLLLQNVNSPMALLNLKERQSQGDRTVKKRIKVVHTSDEIAFYYGKLKAELEKKGSPLDDADLLIASVALANNALLVTNNTRHFNKVPSLQIENWR